MKRLTTLLFAILLLAAPLARADEIGCVSTHIRMLGLANDKICVASFVDPNVPGVACYISRAQTGGVEGKIGIAEDPSEFSISCNQIGPITIDDKFKNGEKVFEEGRSLLFKTMQVRRFYDKSSNALVYLTYSDRIIEGSPKNSVSAIPIRPWPGK